MRYLSLIAVLFALRSFGKPFHHGHQHSRRYDLDCNGVPGWCYTEGPTAHCMKGDGSWTAFPATQSIECPTTYQAPVTATSSVSVAVITSATKSAASQATSSKGSNGNATTSATLPEPSQFTADKGSRWKIELQGNLAYTGALADLSVGTDKARTGMVGNKVVWNFGDMLCDGDWAVCGFAWGPAFYGTEDVMTVDTSGITLVQQNDLVQPADDDEMLIESADTHWGFDTTNVVPLDDKDSVAFAWEILRSSSDDSYTDRGNLVATVSMGVDRPYSNRTGPMLSGPDSIQLGLIATLRDGEYIYTYSVGGPSNVIVGRVLADIASVQDASKHEFLEYGNSTSWKPGIPLKSDTSVGATTTNPDGQFGCAVYGSVFYNSYLNKYVMLCSIYQTYVNMYTSDTPAGPWSAEYSVTMAETDGLLLGSYGAMAHPAYGDGKEWYFSIGPNSVIQVFKVTFDY